MKTHTAGVDVEILTFLPETEIHNAVLDSVQGMGGYIADSSYKGGGSMACGVVLRVGWFGFPKASDLKASKGVAVFSAFVSCRMTIGNFTCGFAAYLTFRYTCEKKQCRYVSKYCFYVLFIKEFETFQCRF